jgi:TonB family protein
MTLLLDLAIRSSILVLVGLAVAAVLHRQSAALRHAVLAMTVIAAAALVPLTAIVPTWQVSLPVSLAQQWSASRASTAPRDVAGRVDRRWRDDAAAAAHMTGSRAVPARPTVRVVEAARVVWVTGVVVCAAVLLTGFVRLARIARRAQRVRGGEWVRAASQLQAAYGLRRPVTLLQTDAPGVLATFGVRHHRVLLPVHASAWSHDRIHAVLSHELAHVRRQDWLVQMSAEALRCVYWFNPLMWIACARLRCESEYACDDAVLGRGMAPRDYAVQLLELARVCRHPRRHAALSAIPMARASTLERRITVMLNPAVNRTSVSRRALVAAAALLACLSLSVAAVRAGQGAQNAPAPLVGSIYDASGGVLPGVDLTLQDAQQATWTATTNESGRFEFPSVAPGTYVLEAKLAGFRRLRQDIALRTAGDWDRAITLQVGEVSEKIIVSASRVAVPTGPSRAQPIRIKVGGNVRAPRKLHDVAPVYPSSMREAGREGVVPVEAVIGTDGSVTSVRVLSAEVHPDFAIAAVEAVRQWTFDPTLLNGAPVEVRMTVSVEFTLSK